MLSIPKDELKNRTICLQELMQTEGLDGVLITHNANLFYFSGMVQQAYLYIPAAGEPALMVRKSLSRAQELSELSTILPGKGFRGLPRILDELGHPIPRTLGMELDVLPVNQFRKLQRLFADAEITDAWPLIRQVRSAKSEFEVEALKHAAEVADIMFGAAKQNLRAGIREIELVSLIEAAARRNGHQGAIRLRAYNQEVFYGHLLSGPDATLPSYMDSPTGGRGISAMYPQGASARVIGENEPVLIDMVAAVDGYLIDQTRIFAVESLDQRLVDAHQATLKIQNQAAQFCRPGILATEVFERSRKLAEDAGLAKHFMGYGESQVPFVGHGVGIELDEYPPLAKGIEVPLEEGMVLALEPKFAFPGLGVVGIENTFIVRSWGLERLSLTPDEIVFV